MAAERLASHETTFKALVTDIRLDSRRSGSQLWQVALDRTAFCSERDGARSMGRLVAVARSGAVLEVPVERVEVDAAGEVWHFVRKPLIEGTVVTGHVNEPPEAER